MAALLGLAVPSRLPAQLPPPAPTMAAEAAPPVAIEGLDSRPATPLEFSHAWLGKAEQVRRRRAELAAVGRLDGADPLELAAEGAALTGVLRVPVVPIVYAGTAPPFGHAVLAERLFGAAPGDTMSYAEYWNEVSGGLLRVTGAVAPWVTLEHEASHYLPKEEYGWARFGRIVEFREEVVQAADRSLDFGRFDNDGPDGLPDSGDDDGFVDFAAFVYALPCDGDWRAGAIWPHRGAMPPFETDDVGANGESIKVTDYVILPALEPGTCTPMHIGVLAHETGHALGLPDLYDYDGSSQGIGAWGLMGTGAHAERWSPAHLSGWAKEQLGWVRVDWLRQDGASLRIPPVEREPVVFRYDIPGSQGEYLLLENRQHIGSDAYLPGTGLLVWRVNPDRAELGGWNRDELRSAVGLVEADGRADLERGGGADSGDPFPGETGQRRLALDPLIPFSLSDISEHDQVITAKAKFGFGVPTLVATPGVVRIIGRRGGEPIERSVAVRHEGDASGAWSAHPSAGWIEVVARGEELLIRADPAALPPGVYVDTIQLALENGRRTVAAPVAGAPGDQSSDESAGAVASPESGKGSGVSLDSAAVDADAAAADAVASLDSADTGAAAADATASAAAPASVAGSEQPNVRLMAAKAPGIPVGSGAEGTSISETEGTAAANHEPTADAGPTYDSKSSGLRAGTTNPEPPRKLLGRPPVSGRIVVQMSVTVPGVPQVIATGLPWSWGLAARDGRLFQAGYGWDPLALRPLPRVLSFRDGQRHPSTLARLPADALYAPVAVEDGSTYVLARAQEENYLYRVGPDGAAAVVASRLGDVPAYGVALAPDGSVLVADWAGTIRRITATGEVKSWGAVGAHTYQIAADGLGAVYAATYGGDVIRLDAQGGRTIFATGFGPGRLVAVTATASGAVYAAERGGEGRIIRIAPDGAREIVARVDGAEFYGLALDRGFLYALDLHHRQLLRIPLREGDTAPVVATH